MARTHLSIREKHSYLNKISTSALHSRVLPSFSDHVLLNWSRQSLLTVTLFVVHSVYCGSWLKQIVWTDGKPVIWWPNNAGGVGLRTSIRVDSRAASGQPSEVCLRSCTRHRCLFLTHWGGLSPYLRIHHFGCGRCQFQILLILVAVSVTFYIIGKWVLLSQCTHHILVLVLLYMHGLLGSRLDWLVRTWVFLLNDHGPTTLRSFLIVRSFKMETCLVKKVILRLIKVLTMFHFN